MNKGNTQPAKQFSDDDVANLYFKMIMRKQKQQKYHCHDNKSKNFMSSIKIESKRNEKNEREVNSQID